jgi:hypothetical protein
LHALGLGGLGEAMALGLFTLNAGGPGVLDGKGAPGALQRGAHRGLVIKVDLDYFGAEGLQGLGGITVGRARQCPQRESLPDERSQRGAALLAGRTGYRDSF